MTSLDALFDRGLLEEMLEWGFVRTQDHPEFPLRIFNYTQQAQYEHVWNDVTRQCRGLIVNTETDEIVARPFPKFHNYAEHDQRDGLFELRMDAPVEVTDKLDGSLGIIYSHDGQWRVATRGSFTSDQALWASATLQEFPYSNNHAEGLLNPAITHLVEIIYPENRIVVDYKGMQALILLAGVEIETGRIHSAHDLPWYGERAETFKAETLADALALEPRENVEGVVVRYLDDDSMLKIKQDDYVHLHRIMTGLNARNVWELVAVRACAPLIKDWRHWGSYLGIGWERAEECLAVGDDWLEGVPDEFYGWIEDLSTELHRQHGIQFVAAVAQAVAIREAHPDDQRSQYEAANSSVYVKELLTAIRQHNVDPLFLRVWRELEPAPTAPFARSEDVA